MRSIASAENLIAIENLDSPAVMSDSGVFDPRKHLASFETRSDALERKEALIRVLNAGGKQARVLADVLTACESGARCGLATCPFCMRRFRARFLIPEVCAQIANWQERTGELGVAVSVVPARLKLALGELHKLDLRKMLDAFRQQLRRAGYGNCISITGVDMSFNEHSEGAWEAHWQPHLYCLVLTADRPAKVRAALGEHFPADESVRVPVHAKRLEDPMRAVSYICKPFFQRRVTYIAPNGRLTARKLPLRPEQLREVAPFFADEAPTERLLFMRIRRRGHHLVEA